jgi:hypothetical protein
MCWRKSRLCCRFGIRWVLWLDLVSVWILFELDSDELGCRDGWTGRRIYVVDQEEVRIVLIIFVGFAARLIDHDSPT